MEKYYFSAKTLGFYPESLKELYEEAGTWPEDAVEITKACYDRTIFCEKGRELSSKDGKPVRIKRMTSPEEYLALNSKTINRSLDIATKKMQPYQFRIDIGEGTEEDEAKVLEYKKYIVALHRLKTGDLSGKIKLPESPEEV